MQSIKNTTVSIILLFLSYGVYQVITQPLPSEQNSFEPEPFAVIDSVAEDAVVAENLNLQTAVNGFAKATQDNIPSELLNLELPESKTASDFNAVPDLQPMATNDFENDASQLVAKTESQPEFAQFVPQQPNNRFENKLDNDFASNQPSATQPTAPLPSQTDPAVNQTISYNAPSVERSPSHFESDSQIIPSTVLGAVAPRPGANGAANQTVSALPKTLNQVWPTIEELVKESKFQEALFTLSGFYHDGNYNDQEAGQLVNWLDALAAKVIYSSEFHMQSKPYTIQSGDTIGSLARRWQVPAQLIYNVNTRSIPNPNQLEPGVEIKMIEGPFDAEVDSQQGLMTLYLDDMYAGRFQVKSSLPMQPDSVRITDKSAQDQQDRPFWIALSNGGAIYATDAMPNQQTEIGMSLREAEEVFSILSASSEIRILR